MANTEKAPSAAKSSFDDALAGNYAEPAKSLGNAIFKKITSLSSNNALAEIHAKIATAASQEDDAQLETLFAELKKAKNDQKNVTDQYKAIRNSNKFETILLAYSEEFRDLAHSIAAEVIKGTDNALKSVKTRKSKNVDESSETTKGTRASRPVVDHVIGNDKGEKITFPGRAGRAIPNLEQDREAFEFLGFKVEKEDGKDVLNPSTITLDDNTEVPATRVNIIKVLSEKTGLKGFTLHS
ncbi:hypothetical protein [Pseudomonas caricapapayae]|uniref:hypothetical protein n=1 Tax=Pseudomonas caricapapayae TaxID=46678 RepID=UPI000EFF6630|nr:hypothetical protein [Pseudomonas caricapapayae]